MPTNELVTSSSLISEGSSSGAKFEPWLVAVILAAIASLVFMIWCKKKFESGTVLREVDISGAREEHGPHLWDVSISSDRRGLEGWSWKTIQPLSVSEQPSLPPSSSSPVSKASAVQMVQATTLALSAQQKRSAHLDSRQPAEVLAISVVIALPSQSQASANSESVLRGGRVQQAGVSREVSDSGVLEGKSFEYVFGVAHAPALKE